MDINETARKQVRMYLRSLVRLWLAVALGVIAFGIAAAVAIGSGMEPQKKDLGQILLFVGPLSAFALVLLGRRMFMMRVEQAQAQEGLYQKMETYRLAVLLRIVLTDAAAMFNIAAFMLSGNVLMLGFAGAVLGIYFTLKPGLEKLISDLNLTPLEAQVMRDHAA